VTRGAGAPRPPAVRRWLAALVLGVFAALGAPALAQSGEAAQLHRRVDDYWAWV
jgi:hypothetical protein